MNIEATIASWIKEARKSAGLSGEALAAQLVLDDTRGASKANISHWETGKHSPNLAQLMAIVKVTNQSLPDAILSALQAKGRTVRTRQAAGVDPTEGKLREVSNGSPSPSSRDAAPWNLQPPNLLADLGVITGREARVLSALRMAVDAGADFIEQTAMGVDKKPLAAVVDDEAKSELPGGHEGKSL